MLAYALAFLALTPAPCHSVTEKPPAPVTQTRTRPQGAAARENIALLAPEPSKSAPETSAALERAASLTDTWLTDSSNDGGVATTRAEREEKGTIVVRAGDVA